MKRQSRKIPISTEVETEDPGILLTHTSKSNTCVFEVATEEDITGITALGAELFGENGSPSYAQRLAQYKANPEIFSVLKQDSQVIGYIGMFPLKKKAINSIMSGMEEARFRTSILSPENILQFKQGDADNIFLIIGVKQGQPRSKNYGFRVIHGSICLMEKFARQGVIIKKLYGTSRTQDGIRLATATGFEQVTPSNEEDDLYRFELDLETTTSKYFQKYQKIARQVKEKQASDRKTPKKNSRFVHPKPDERTTI